MTLMEIIEALDSAGLTIVDDDLIIEQLGELGMAPFDEHVRIRRTEAGHIQVVSEY